MSNPEFLADLKARLAEEARQRREHFFSNRSWAAESQRPPRTSLPPGTTFEFINGRFVRVTADDLAPGQLPKFCAGSKETLCEY
jgi:hypothetical protein